MNPIVILIIITFSILILILPREFSFLPILISIPFTSMAHGINIGSLYFPAIRIFILVGFARVCLKKELNTIKWNSLDKAVLIWAIYYLIIYSILYRSPSSIMLKFAKLIEEALSYFVFRALIHSMKDIKNIFKTLTLIIIPFSFLMLIENRTHFNPFSLIGGVQAHSYIRDGKYRCQASFANSLTVGAFGATIFPFIISLYFNYFNIFLCFISVIATCIIVYTAASSGAILTLLFCVIGLLAWNVRHNMKTIRIGIVLFLVGYEIFAKSHVWFIIAKISHIAGGTGWHRSELIDQAFNYFTEWCFIGSTYTAHWFPYVLAAHPNHTDITNQFLNMGINGGLILMFLYINIFVKAYKYIGIGLTNSYKKPFNQQFFIWALGASLLGHNASFFSITYYDQTAVFFALLISLISIIPQNTEKLIPKVI